MAAVLALFTSVTYGLSNYLGPRLARDAPYLLVLALGQGASLVLSVVALAGVGDPVPDGASLGWAAIAGVANAVGLMLFYEAVRTGALSIVMPIGSIGVAIPVGVGLASGETATSLQVAGMVLAVGGLILVARRPGRPVATIPGEGLLLEREQHADRRRAIVLSLLAAIGFGVFLATIKPASEDSATWGVAVSRLTLVAILVVAALRVGAFAGRRSARRLALLAVPGVLLFAGTLAYAAATRIGDLSVVSVLGSLFTIVTVGLAVTLDHERLPRPAWLGVTAAIVGVILLSAR